MNHNDIGNRVHYVLNHGQSAGKHRAADVVNVLADGSPVLNVLLDAGEDLDICKSQRGYVLQVRGAMEDGGTMMPGTWHHIGKEGIPDDDDGDPCSEPKAGNGEEELTPPPA